MTTDRTPEIERSPEFYARNTLGRAERALAEAHRAIAQAAGYFSPGDARRIALDALDDEAGRVLKTCADYRNTL